MKSKAALTRENSAASPTETSSTSPTPLNRSAATGRTPSPPAWSINSAIAFSRPRLSLPSASYPGCTSADLSACPAQLALRQRKQRRSGLRRELRIPSGPHRQGDPGPEQCELVARQPHAFSLGVNSTSRNRLSSAYPRYNGVLNYQSFSDFVQNGSSGDAYLNLADGNPAIPFTEPDVAAYFQDDWKVTPNFTAHIGLRWEYFGQALNELHEQTVARESNPATAFWNPSLPLAARTVPAVDELLQGV